ncbi:MAG: hypothetical protein LBP26_08100 [Clostridiales bacterium]|jgi:hypothetical protein|nr:hypothetical protein [Clostridiales bacterium]
MEANEIKELREPIFLDNAVILNRQEYERLSKLDLAVKLAEAEDDIINGRVQPIEVLFAKLDEKVRALKDSGLA